MKVWQCLINDKNEKNNNNNNNNTLSITKQHGIMKKPTFCISAGIRIANSLCSAKDLGLEYINWDL